MHACTDIYILSHSFHALTNTTTYFMTSAKLMASSIPGKDPSSS